MRLDPEEDREPSKERRRAYHSALLHYPSAFALSGLLGVRAQVDALANKAEYDKIIEAYRRDFIYRDREQAT